MTIASLDDYYKARKQWIRYASSANDQSTGSSWISGAGTGTGAIAAIGNVTTGVVPVAGDTGFPSIRDTGGAMYITRAEGNYAHGNNTLLVVDRLWHGGAFTGSGAVPLTYNLSGQPSFSARLPGGSFEGLMIFGESWAGAGGGTSPNVALYTNSGNTANRVSGAQTFRNVPNGAGAYPLQAADTGVKSIEQVTCPAVVGNTFTWNIVIVRPLLWLRPQCPSQNSGAAGQQGSREFTLGMEDIGMPLIYPTSAISVFWRAEGGGSGGPQPNFELNLELAQL